MSSAYHSRGSSRKRQAPTTNEKVEDVLTKAEKRLESITANNLFDRYGKHNADRLRQISPNQIKFIQKLMSDVLFEGEMESLNRNCKIVDMGEKEAHSRPSISIQHTNPPRFEQYQLLQYNVPPSFQYQQPQTEFPCQLGALRTEALQQTTNQLATGSAVNNTPPAPLASGSALAEYVSIFSDQNA